MGQPGTTFLHGKKNEVKLETEKYKKDQQTKAVQITFHSDHKLDYGQQVLYRGGYLFPQTFYYRLKLDKICRKLRDKYNLSMISTRSYLISSMPGS